MKKETENNLRIYVGMFLMIAGSIALGMAISEYTKLRIPTYLTDDSQKSDCGSDDLYMKAECLRTELKTFFKYNLSNVGKKMTIEELKQEGGVCSHYSEWYKQQFELLGGVYLDDTQKKLTKDKDVPFYITANIIPLEKNESHVNLFISNSKQICLIDMINEPRCFIYKNETS